MMNNVYLKSASSLQSKLHNVWVMGSSFGVVLLGLVAIFFVFRFIGSNLS
ncbi:hypothetical protein OPW10_17960 [Vibrio europaeus]|nr:hypothetical protein [Vibrio europaeus]